MGKQETFTKKEALKLLKYKDGQGKNTKIAEFNQKIAEWRASNPGKKFDLDTASLGSLNLSGIDLHEVDLSLAFLKDSDLSGANLRNAVLYGANLCNTKLSGANLRNADMRRADVVGANLSEADLRGADTNGVYLTMANTYGAKYSTGENGTQFSIEFEPSRAWMVLENEPVSPSHPEAGGASPTPQDGATVSYVATWLNHPKAEFLPDADRVAGVTARKHPDATLGVTEITVGAPAAKRRSQE